MSAARQVRDDMQAAGLQQIAVQRVPLRMPVERQLTPVELGGEKGRRSAGIRDRFAGARTAELRKFGKFPASPFTDRGGASA